MHALSQPQIAPGETHAPRTGEAQCAPISQALTLILDGITSDDYLQWVRDPDPPDRGDLILVSVRSAPLSNRIQLELISDSGLPAPRLAAQAVGFPITADVVSVHSNSERATVVQRFRYHGPHYSFATCRGRARLF